MSRPADVDVAIAGGGIAGLTAALAFAKKGFSVRVLERAPTLEEAGAGIQLSPNATRILERLGALDALQAVAVRPEAITLESAASLRRLARVPLGAAGEARWGAPYLVAHRADLQAALARCVDATKRVTLTAGATVANVTPDGDGASVSFERDGTVETVRCGLAVGADGVWSRLRGFVRPTCSSRFSGYLAWRAMIEAADLADAGAVFDITSVTAFLSPRFHLVAYPVRDTKAVNLVAVTRGRALAENWSVRASTGALATATARAAKPIAAMAEAVPWTAWPIHTVDWRGAWTKGGQLALIGDAAHAMTPFAAQGAAMAIEDAAVLANCVAGTHDTASALSRYETLRQPRVRRVAGRGAFNRFVWHASGPIAFGRDTVLSLRAETRLMRDFDWLYGWDETAADGRRTNGV